MRISLAAKRKPRVNGHEGAELRISEIERETAESAKKKERKTDSRLGRTGQTEIRARLAFERQTAVADVAGGDGIAGRLLRVKESKKISGVTRGRRIQSPSLSGDRLAASTSPRTRYLLARDGPQYYVVRTGDRRPTPLSAMRDLKRTRG